MQKRKASSETYLVSLPEAGRPELDFIFAPSIHCASPLGLKGLPEFCNQRITGEGFAALS
jgi:hypothetical protein